MKDIDKILNNLRRQCSRREYCTSDVQKKAEKALEGDKEKAAACHFILIILDGDVSATVKAEEKTVIARNEVALCPRSCYLQSLDVSYIGSNVRNVHTLLQICDLYKFICRFHIDYSTKNW
jgi:hypothetical protein